MRRALRLLMVLGLFLFGRTGWVQAGVPDWTSCPTPPPAAAVELDRLLQLAGMVQDELAAQGAPVALIARSGLNLRAIGHRYSHAGFVRRLPVEAGVARLSAQGAQEAQGPAWSPSPFWSVRQLYFDCTGGEPRLFDEGLPGFIRGVATDVLPRLSVLWLPPPADRVLAEAVGRDDLALALLSPRYQAQAHVWSLESQNCNQWLAEMLAVSFGAAPNRASAQHWLRAQAYRGSVVQLPHVGWLVAASVLPHMGLQHHPEADLQALRLEVALPQSIEQFVRSRWPQARRAEWCLRGREVVVRRAWDPLDEACTPGAGDAVLDLSR